MILTEMANPVDMIVQGAPRLIRNDDELARYTAELFELTAKEAPSLAEQEAIDLLGLLIETYEREHYALPPAGGVEVLRFLLQSHSLTQRDLVPTLGSESLVSQILSGDRRLTLKHVQSLAKRFSVSPLAFMGEF